MASAWLFPTRLSPDVICPDPEAATVLLFPHADKARTVSRRQRHDAAIQVVGIRFTRSDMHLAAGQRRRPPAIAQQHFGPARSRDTIGIAQPSSTACNC
jgi:hypothetical protein